MPESKNILIYGATGYTGKLTARAARAKGLRPILAGRNRDKLRALSGELGLEARVFDLSEPTRIDSALKDIAVVLCIAGPFSATSKPMADACIRNRVHYLDITGEIDVFEALAARDSEAKAAGVMLLPGVGFDVVPSDCLAAHLRRRLPNATELKMYIGGLSSISRGTAKTMVEGIAQGTRLRRGGKLVTTSRATEGSCDFGEGAKPTMAVSWGDVATAWRSTGIPDIEVHFEAVPQLKAAARMPGFIKSFLGLKPIQRFLKSRVDRQPEGPTDEERAKGRGVLVGEAKSPTGERICTRLRVPEGYTLTAMTGLDIASRVVGGEFKPGFQTPSLVFGPDYITGFDGVTREELNA